LQFFFSIIKELKDNKSVIDNPKNKTYTTNTNNEKGTITSATNKQTINTNTPTNTPDTHTEKNSDDSKQKVTTDPNNKNEPTKTVSWIMKPNLANYGGADWNNEVKRVKKISLEEAQKIGAADSQITYFFYVRESLELGKNGLFEQGEAVFFTGKPWYGSTTQTDLYEKSN